MKSFLLVSIALTILSTSAQAAQLLCVSEKEETLYYSTGTVRISAELEPDGQATEIQLSTTGSSNLGGKFTATEIGTVLNENYARSSFSDAWCNYRMALRLECSSLETYAVYLDAYCEGGSIDRLRFNCTIQ